MGPKCTLVKIESPTTYSREDDSVSGCAHTHIGQSHGCYLMHSKLSVPVVSQLVSG